jgi:hypothetical protein
MLALERLVLSSNMLDEGELDKRTADFISIKNI